MDYNLQEIIDDLLPLLKDLFSMIKKYQQRKSED